jgi:transposase
MPKKPLAHLLPRGRPTKYRPEFCRQIIDLMGEGLSLTAAAAELGLTRECCYNWAYTKPEFRQALELGRGKRLLFLERGLLAAKDSVMVASRSFALKAADRYEWGDKQPPADEQQLTEIRIVVVNPQDRRRELAEALVVDSKASSS